MTEAWFAVHAKVGQERLADFNLKRQGYRTFFPSVNRPVRHARSARIERTALFPGYLFVTFDPDRDLWRRIDSTIGVVRLVRSGDRPAVVPAAVIQALLGCADADGVVGLARRLGPGHRMRVSDGPLALQEGLVEQLLGQDRVRALMTLLGRRVAVELPSAICDAA